EQRRPPRRTLRRHPPSLRQSLERLDDSGRGGRIYPVRADKRFDESTATDAVHLRIVKCLVQLFDVFIERVGNTDETAIGAAKMLEMERPFLCRLEFRRKNCQHAASDDRAFDLRRRINPDHGGAVDDRVEVVASALGIARRRASQWPDNGRTVLAQIRLPPLFRVLRMWTDEHARAYTRLSEVLEPRTDERHLLRRDEARRADIQN